MAHTVFETDRFEKIFSLFAGACRLVGVEYRANRNSVRIYRRASVALMLEHVGTKS